MELLTNWEINLGTGKGKTGRCHYQYTYQHDPLSDEKWVKFIVWREYPVGELFHSYYFNDLSGPWEAEAIVYMILNLKAGA